MSGLQNKNWIIEMQGKFFCSSSILKLLCLVKELIIGVNAGTSVQYSSGSEAQCFSFSSNNEFIGTMDEFKFFGNSY